MGRFSLPIIYIVLNLFAFPISSFISEFTGIESNSISISARAVALFFTVLFFIYVYSKKAFVKTPDFWLFMVFWLLYSVRILHDIILHGNSLGRPPVDYLLFGLAISFFSTLPAFNKIDLDLEKLEKYIFFILAIIGLMSIYNFHFGNAIQSVLAGQTRAGANERLNPITYAFFSTSLIAISFKNLLLNKNTLTFRLLYMLGLLIGAYSLLLSSSRGPIIFLSVFLLMIFGFSLKRTPLKSFVIIATVTAFFFIVINVFKLQTIFQEMIVSRFLTLSSSETLDASAEGRYDAYVGAINQFISSPLFGSSLEEKTLRQYPHNLVIESFMAVGVLGGLVFTVIYFRFLFFSISSLVRSRFSGIFIIGLSACIGSLFSGGLSFDFEFWFGYAIASMYINKGTFDLNKQGYKVTPPLHS